MDELTADGQEASTRVRTGVPAVDSVLDAVEEALGLDVAERVPVYERAHEQLRRALDADQGE